MALFSFAGLQFNIDIPAHLISSAFASFSADTGLAPVRVALGAGFEPESASPDVSVTAGAPAAEAYMQVSPTSQGYRFLYSAESPLSHCDVDISARESIIQPRCAVCGPDWANGNFASESFDLTAIREALFFAIRDIFFLFALREGRVPVHSSSIIYNGRAYLFSARSGTGKTTHTNFWVEKYGVEILNGDIAMLALEDGQMYAYGLPWCGTSGRFTNKRVPLGAVIFLYRGEENSIMPLSLSEGITSLLARTLSTSFERKDVEQNLTAITSFAPYTTFLRLVCTNSPDAAETVKQYLDANH